MARTCPVPAVLYLVISTLSLSPAFGQSSEPTERERDLMDLVERLNARIEQLEGRLEKLEQAQPAAFAPGAPEMEQRVQQLETSVEQIKQATPPAEGSPEYAQMVKWFADGHTLRTYWKDGLRFDSIDGSFKLKIGGRIQHDWAYFTEESDLERSLGEDLDDGTEFRRARVYVSGTVYDNIEFKAQYDFAGGDADFKDVYMGLTKVPVVGNIRVGHFKEPFSLEELTSSNYITFMERSLANAFAPSRNAGIMFHNDMLDKRMTWAAGFFRETDDFGDGSGPRGYNATVRLTGLPWYAEEGRKLLHLGVAYTHKNFSDDMVRYRERPESHLAPRFVDTGAFEAEYSDVVGAELAWVHGPFSLQGEYTQAFVESRTMSDPSFWAAYVQASYFLTGEHRPYSTSSGTFGNVHPNRNFGLEGGSGAWEVAARYSYLDLNDGDVDGGRLRDFTFGLNWYLNANLRMMWNYIFADAADTGEANIFQWRFQIAF